MEETLSKMSVDQLRKILAGLGADEKTLFGTSKTTMIVLIHRMRLEARNKLLKSQKSER